MYKVFIRSAIHCFANEDDDSFHTVEEVLTKTFTKNVVKELWSKESRGEIAQLINLKIKEVPMTIPTSWNDESFPKPIRDKLVSVVAKTFVGNIFRGDFVEPLVDIVIATRE